MNSFIWDSLYEMKILAEMPSVAREIFLSIYLCF